MKILTINFLVGVELRVEDNVTMSGIDTSHIRQQLADAVFVHHTKHGLTVDVPVSEITIKCIGRGPEWPTS